MKLFGKKPAPPPPAPPPTMRDTLYGDMPINDWPKDNSLSSEPWTSFMQARQLLAKGSRDDAIAQWKRITQMPNLEARHYVQAWNFLRGQGAQPSPEQAKHVYGVVVEYMMEQGLDLLAAYEDRSARYYNYSGAGVVWEHPDDRLDAPIKQLLDIAGRVAAAIGPWEGARPGVPPKGHIRLSMLTPSGLHFGQGEFNALNADPMGKALIGAATQLMVQMTQLRQ
jgi:hypothetical protein